MELLFINNAKLHSSAGDITLMFRRAEAMRQYGIETTFLSIVNSASDEEYACKTSRIINSNPNDRLLSICEYIKENKPLVICFYGNKTLLMFNKILHFIKTQINYNPQIYIDMQGALEEAIDYKHGIELMKEIPAFLAKKLLFSISLSKADGVFTVSDEMFEYSKKLSLNAKLKNIKIRCGITDIISSEVKFKNRNTVRSKWKIDDRTIVMCFSGYRAPWQNVEKIIEFYSRMDSFYENLFFAFFCNTDDEFEDELKLKFPKNNYIVKFLSQEQYFTHLCACDIGFLIRENNTTNRVAFPNKFSDYLNAGLLCYISESLKEPCRVLKMAEIPFIKESEDDMENVIKSAKQRQGDLSAYYACSERACREFLLFESQFKNQNLERLIN